MEKYPVSTNGVRLEYDRPFVGDDELMRAVNADIEAKIGEPLPIVAGIRAGEDQFLVLDSRPSERYQTPFLLLQEDVSRRKFKGIWPNKVLSIGRGHHTDRFTYDSRVSQNHFSLHLDTDTQALVLRDLNSTNGTLVTGSVSEDESGNGAVMPGLEALYTELFQESLQDRHDVGNEDVDAPHGYYHNHPIIGRKSTSVRNGVYGTRSSERVVVDEKSRLVRQAIATLGEQLIDIEAAPTITTRQVLRIIEQQTATLLRYDLQRTDAMSRPFYCQNSLINLSDYLKEGVGVCRHQALLAALFIEEATKKGLLKGSVAVERNHDLIAQGAHAWAVYRDDAGHEYIVDAAQHFVGTREEARAQKRWRYNLPT